MAARVAAIAEPVLEGLGFRLIRVRLSGSQAGGSTMQIMAERPDGTFTIDDCEAASRALSPVLDVADPISGEYALEVSSPGWDRPFFQLEQMSGYTGQQVALRLISAVENRRKFQAKLIAVDLENEMIQVEVENQHVLDIDSHNIDKAHLIYQD